MLDAGYWMLVEDPVFKRGYWSKIPTLAGILDDWMRRLNNLRKSALAP